MSIRKKIKVYRKILTALVLTTVVVPIIIASYNKAHGQTVPGFNIELSPGKINVSVEPGETFTQTFRIGNYSGSDRKLYIYVQDFTVINEEGTPTFFENKDLDEEARRFALSQWVKLPSETVDIENNKVAEIEATISVPEDAEAGGHYGAFFVQTETPESTGTAVGSVGRLVSLMLINVPGDVEENIIFTQVTTDKQIYWEDNPEITLTTMLKNEGSVHGIPVGAFHVSGGYGAKSKSIIYNTSQGAVLPGAPERRISESFTLDKKGSVVPPIGKFTIELVARYGTNNLPLDTTLFFWMLPAKFIAVSALIAVVSLFVLWRALVSFKK